MSRIGPVLLALDERLVMPLPTMEGLVVLPKDQVERLHHLLALQVRRPQSHQLALLLGQAGFPQQVPTLHRVRQGHAVLFQFAVVPIMVGNKTQEGLVGLPAQTKAAIKIRWKLIRSSY